MGEDIVEEICCVCTAWALLCGQSQDPGWVYTLPGLPPGASRELLEVNELRLTKDYPANCGQPPQTPKPADGSNNLAISQPQSLGRREVKLLLLALTSGVNFDQGVVVSWQSRTWLRENVAAVLKTCVAVRFTPGMAFFFMIFIERLFTQGVPFLSQAGIQLSVLKSLHGVWYVLRYCATVTAWSKNLNATNDIHPCSLNSKKKIKNPCSLCNITHSSRLHPTYLTLQPTQEVKKQDINQVAAQQWGSDQSKQRDSPKLCLLSSFWFPFGMNHYRCARLVNTSMWRSHVSKSLTWLLLWLWTSRRNSSTFWGDVLTLFWTVRWEYENNSHVWVLRTEPESRCRLR